MGYLEARILNTMLACSTIVIGGFYKVRPNEGEEAFLKLLKESLEYRGKEGQFEWEFDDRGGYDYDLPYHWTDFSTVVASVTDQDHQKKVAEILEKVGFKGSQLAYNSKNCTNSRIMVISVPELKEKFEEYNL